MKIRQWIIAVPIMVSATACATAPSRPIHTEFEDVPVPKGLVYQPSKSLIIESPNAKAARLVYRGRIASDTLRLATRANLEANGWRHVSTSTNADRWTVQVYEKAGNSLQVAIYEGLWFTYAVFGASQTLPASPPTAVGAVEHGTVTTTAGLADESAAGGGNSTSRKLDELQPISEAPPASTTTPSNPKDRSRWEKARDGINGFFTNIFSIEPRAGSSEPEAGSN